MPELLAFNLSSTCIGMKKELKMPELILYRSKVAVRHVRSGTALRHGFQHASHGVSFLDADAQLNRMGSLLGSCRKLSRNTASGSDICAARRESALDRGNYLASFNKKAKSNRNRTATGHCLHCTPCTTLRLLLEF
jgi:hypothetical protein